MCVLYVGKSQGKNFINFRKFCIIWHFFSHNSHFLPHNIAENFHLIFHFFPHPIRWPLLGRKKIEPVNKGDALETLFVLEPH